MRLVKVSAPADKGTEEPAGRHGPCMITTVGISLEELSAGVDRSIAYCDNRRSTYARFSTALKTLAVVASLAAMVVLATWSDMWRAAEALSALAAAALALDWFVGITAKSDLFADRRARLVVIRERIARLRDPEQAVIVALYLLAVQVLVEGYCGNPRRRQVHATFGQRRAAC